LTAPGGEGRSRTAAAAAVGDDDDDDDQLQPPPRGRKGVNRFLFGGGTLTRLNLQPVLAHLAAEAAAVRANWAWLLPRC
jgi:hypothetical protein